MMKTKTITFIGNSDIKLILRFSEKDADLYNDGSTIRCYNIGVFRDSTSVKGGYRNVTTLALVPKADVLEQVSNFLEFDNQTKKEE